MPSAVISDGDLATLCNQIDVIELLGMWGVNLLIIPLHHPGLQEVCNGVVLQHSAETGGQGLH